MAELWSLEGERFVRKSRRVVITGLGVVAPNGIGKQAFYAQMEQKKTA